MKNITCALFDMDGVMIDTEPQYDKFWRQAGKEYCTGIDNFEKIIKGTTLPNILAKYFTHLSDEERKSLIKSLDEFELNMTFDEIPGSVDFVKKLKGEGLKVGLVTSSTDSKLLCVNRKLHFDKLFDTVVSATNVTQGKPNPECYLLAAQRLGVSPKNCVVFEDSFAGIDAGKSAGMTVIGLYTTHPKDDIEAKQVLKAIPDFTDFNLSSI